MKTIAIVVPDLQEQGGVRTVAAFLLNTIEASRKYKSKVISLATSSADDCSIRMLSPKSWFGGVRCESRKWCSRLYTHVGAVLPEFEFQRYRKRSALTQQVAGCDLIQVVSGSPAIGRAVSGLGIPVVLQVATRAVVERRRKEAEGGGFKLAWRRQMTRITDYFDDTAIRSADALMVENCWMQAYCEEVLSQQGSRVLFAPPGVDASMFFPRGHRMLGDPQSDYILSVGRLHDERKNVGLLLEAYHQLRLRQSAAPKLVLAGATAPPKSFWARANSFGLSEHIQFINKPSLGDLIRLYQGAKCFVLSSDEEGFGMVLIEAMACGVPAVSTRSGGPDGIIEDGRDGFLVPLNEAGLLAQRMESLCFDEQLNMRMGKLARAKVLDQYDLPVAGGRFIDIYDEILDQQYNDSIGR